MSVQHRRCVCHEFVELRLIYTIPFFLPCKSLPNSMQLPFFAYSIKRTCTEFGTDLKRRKSEGEAKEERTMKRVTIWRKKSGERRCNRNGVIPLPWKKLKVFEVGGFTLCKNRLLRIDYQWFMMGETLYKRDLLFLRGFTLCYFLIINVLYCKNGMGETPYLKNFWFFYIRLLKNYGNV